jgi:hypothetical protein
LWHEGYDVSRDGRTLSMVGVPNQVWGLRSVSFSQKNDTNNWLSQSANDQASILP